MTSEQVMLSAALVLAWLNPGCSTVDDMFDSHAGADPLISPYPVRQVWAVAPLRNESGSMQPDPARMADKLQMQLENAGNLDVLPVNRVIDAMNMLHMPAINTPDDAANLAQLLGVDGLVVGTITTYDPYDPPKIGLAIELYAPAPKNRSTAGAPDAHQLASASTSDQATMAVATTERNPRKPASTVSAVLDAGDPYVRAQMQRYASRRGAIAEPEGWRKYRISMDLFSEFASYVMSWRLLDAERTRLTPPVDAKKPPAQKREPASP